VFEALVNTCIESAVEDAKGKNNFTLQSFNSTDGAKDLSFEFTGYAEIKSGHGMDDYTVYEQMTNSKSPSKSPSRYRIFDVVHYIVNSLDTSAGSFCVTPKGNPNFDAILFTTSGTNVKVHALQTTSGQTHPFHPFLWSLFKDVLEKALTGKAYSVSFSFTYLLDSSVKLQTDHKRPSGESPRYVSMTMVDELVNGQVWSDQTCSRFMKHFD
jgi:hypothetical protein